jgi:hypothetical protein
MDPEWLRKAQAEGRVTVQKVNNSALGGEPQPRKSEVEARPKRKNKYGNEVVRHEGLTFHSKKELKRWLVLELLLKCGEIKDLRRQVAYPLVVNGVTVSRYTADFVYLTQDGRTVVEDTKSEATAQDRSYGLRKRLVKALYNIDIVEV